MMIAIDSTARQNPATTPRRNWAFSRQMLVDQIAFGALIWAGLLLVILAIVIGIAIWGEVNSSVWDPTATQIPRWFILFIGVYIVQHHFPLHIAYGQTRRDFAIQGGVFAAAYTAVASLLMTIVFPLERLLYDWRGWPHEIPDAHIYSSAYQLHLIFIETWLAFLVWFLAGAFIAAGFYRSDAGAATIPLAVIPIAITDLALGGQWGPINAFVGRVINIDSVPAPLGIALGLLAAFGTAWATWLIVRDMSVRPKSS
jgi:hypothetical protein